MKIILYIEGNRDGTIGGSYYSLMYLVQGLNKTEYEPHVLFCQDNVLVPEFRNVTPHVYVDDFGPTDSQPDGTLFGKMKWPARLAQDVLLNQRRIGKILDRVRPDLVHINNGYSSMHEVMLACYRRKIKVVAHDRGTRYPCSFRTRLFVRLLDATISVSDSYKGNLIRQNLKPKRIRRVYNGLDPDTFERNGDPRARETLRSEFHLRADQPVVGIVGNIDTWKGQLVVVGAIAMLREKFPEVTCLIVGKTPAGAERYEKSIRDSIREKGLTGRVLLTGFRKDIPRILSLLDVLIHASVEPEPFGRVILEGMATGKPIVATKPGGPAEIIVHGETGLLVPMNDCRKMADAVCFYLSDKERALTMGRAGRNRLIRDFSVANMVGETEKIYEEIFHG